MGMILIVDDDRALCRSMQIHLEGAGNKVSLAHTGRDALEEFDRSNFDIVFLDLNLPDTDGFEVLKKFVQQTKSIPIVVITGRQDMDATIQAMRDGAFDYLRKPFDLDDVFLIIEKSKRFIKSQKNVASVDSKNSFSLSPYEIVGNNKKILEIIKTIGLLSRNKVTVLIEGESGTGKEIVARALHKATSPDEPFVAINCSAIVSTLFESELFGYEKGAFTGAMEKRKGKLEFAGSGTLFFDEIGDLPLEMQPKILRVLQENQFMRVGGSEVIHFSARVVAATNRNLKKLTEEGKFREDLFYRLSVTTIHIPPLRERKADIPLITNYLIKRICSQLHRSVLYIDKKVMKYLISYDWPGNIRELENILTRAVALARGNTISLEDLEFPVPKDNEAESEDEILTLHEFEKKYIKRVLRHTNWNITRASSALKISPTTLRKKIKDYGLKKEY